MHLVCALRTVDFARFISRMLFCKVFLFVEVLRRDQLRDFTLFQSFSHFPRVFLVVALRPPRPATGRGVAIIALPFFSGRSQLLVLIVTTSGKAMVLNVQECPAKVQESVCPRRVAKTCAVRPVFAWVAGILRDNRSKGPHF